MNRINPPNLPIRVLASAAELRLVEDLQRQVWQGSETEIVPVHMLLALAHNGGLVLGAFSGDELVGFACGFVGWDGEGASRRQKHASHMLGVQPAWRDRGVGAALKLAQRELALQQGLDLMTWTYDPLQSRNAWLNLTRLGAVCFIYLPEFYGVMRDGLNAGLPADRFEVHWELDSPRVRQRLDSPIPPPRPALADWLAAGIPCLNPAPSTPAEFPLPAAADLPGRVLVEIPEDFAALRLADPALGLAWRLETRRLFSSLFGLGYTAVEFAHDRQRNQSAYLLEKTQ